MVATTSATNGYLRSAWYQAAWASELRVDEPLVRSLLDIPVVIFQMHDGAIMALHDRCPHRFAPLSAGRRHGATVTCGYHGLTFDRFGACIHNPHGKVTSVMRVRYFPAVERHLAIWLWMGDPAQADPSLIPDLGFIDRAKPSARIVTSMPTAGNYQLLTDNILDLSHVEFLHSSSLGGTNVVPEFSSRDSGNQIIANWFWRNCDVPVAFQNLVVPPEKADIAIQISWSAPALMILEATVTRAGTQPAETDLAYTLHNMTPETATTSHYFVCTVRNYHVDDVAFSDALRRSLERAFGQEDKPMIEKVQQRMGGSDLWSLNPVLLPIDAAAVRARRKLRALIEAEAAGSGATR
jgi:vanillate O-demethylase monooxygenase subunit